MILDFKLIKEEVMLERKFYILTYKNLYIVDTCAASEEVSTIFSNATLTAKFTYSFDEAEYAFEKMKAMFIGQLELVDSYEKYPVEIKAIKKDWDNRVELHEKVYPFYLYSFVEFIYKNKRYIISANTFKGSAFIGIYKEYIYPQIVALGATNIEFVLGDID